MTEKVIVNNLLSNCCPLCKSGRTRKVGNIAYHRPTVFSTVEISLTNIPELWKCLDCFSAFVQNKIPENSAIALYETGQSAERWSQEAFQSQKPIEQIKCLDKFFNAGNTVLDIGCNSGELLDYAQSLGCATFGVEYSIASRELIKKKNHGAFTSLDDVNLTFDVITAFDLIEHLYDVPTFIHKCLKLLNKKGVLIILTGNINSLTAKLSASNWWYVRYPEHISFPSKRFFRDYSGIKIQEDISTYASKYYKFSCMRIIMQTVKKIFAYKEIYDGLPSIGPDHMLLVLRNDD